MTISSPLRPIDPSEVVAYTHGNPEIETQAPWILRKLVGSMTGRIVMSAYESLKTIGRSVVCLSPWGDSNTIILPNVRFRDLAFHAVLTRTGGMAAVASPVMEPISHLVLTTLGDSVLVEVILNTGFDVSAQIANDLIIASTFDRTISAPSARLETTGIKKLPITLKYKHTVADAHLGFFRSSVHKDANLFSSVKDYLAIEKGWFNPYLNASARRPIIPRSMKPDIVFCHGPFLQGDYKIGTTLLSASALVIILCKPQPTPSSPINSVTIKGNGIGHKKPKKNKDQQSKKNKNQQSRRSSRLSGVLHRMRSGSPAGALRPRRLVVVLLGISPHRAGLWTSSVRPGESEINYLLLNGCPALLLPARFGAPLVAWNTLTLEHLHNLHSQLPSADGGEGGEMGGERFKGVINALMEFLDCCIDWDRVQLSPEVGHSGIADPIGNDSDRVKGALTDLENKKRAVRNSVTLLVISAISSKNSKEVKKEVDAERAGIVFFRIP